jgi:hypothetical protein
MMGHTKHHMKHKHHRAKGGRVEYDAQGSNVMKEAHEKKHGGGVHVKGHGHKHKHRHKAHGGAVGSDKHPFSSASQGHHSAEHAHGSPHSGFTGRMGGK